MWESRKWKAEFAKLGKDGEEYAEKGQDQVFVVKITRTAGDTLTFNKVRKTFLLQKCSPYLKGLPNWARNLQDDEDKAAAKQDEEENKEAEVEDVDYDKLLAESDPFAAVVAAQ